MVDGEGLLLGLGPSCFSEFFVYLGRAGPLGFIYELGLDTFKYNPIYEKSWFMNF